MSRSDVDYEELFNLSYWRALGSTVNEVPFADAVYQRFLASSPRVAEKFADRSADKPKTMLSLSLTLVASYHFAGEADSVLGRVAQLHSRDKLDIDPSLYQFWIDSIIDTVREYDAESNEDILEAWRRVLVPGADFMRAHYQSGWSSGAE